MSPRRPDDRAERPRQGSSRRTTAGSGSPRSGGSGSGSTGGQAPRPTKAPGRAPAGRPAGARGVKGSGARRTTSPGARIALVSSQRRLRWMLVSMMMVLTLFMGRAMQLQVLDSAAYASKAADQMTRTRALVPQRGSITDRFGTVMAATVPAVQVIADPGLIARNGVDPRVTLSERQQAIGAAAPGAIAAILAKHLGGRPADYLPALTAKGKDGKLTHYQVVTKQVDTTVWNDIQTELQAGGQVGKYKVPFWYGLFKVDNPRRIYPSAAVGGNLVGLVKAATTKDGAVQATGITGVEKFANDALTGTAGKETYESSAYGRIPLGNETLIPAVDGTNYTLTVDATLQQAAEAALAKGVTGTGASTGVAIVMNIKTGEVLADASLPGYDPNKISQTAAKYSLLNRSVENIYEPGSVQKVLTMAALADKGLVTADTHVEVPPKLPSGGGFIRDDFNHETIHLTARGVIANSSNIGTALLARQIDKATLVNYLKSFGLGSRTGIELPAEAAGQVVPADRMQDYQRDQIAFGQGIAVTAVQEAAAVAGVVNDGVYNPPTLLKAATDGSGRPVALPAKTPRRVISQAASAEVRDMMEAVIQLHPEIRAIPGYRTIGKSGTAERPDGKGGYSGFTASFALAAPAENPQILVYVVIDQPQSDAHQGSQVSLPVANEIMKLALPRYGVQPSTTPAPKKPDTYEP